MKAFLVILLVGSLVQAQSLQDEDAYLASFQQAYLETNLMAPVAQQKKAELVLETDFFEEQVKAQQDLDRYMAIAELPMNPMSVADRMFYMSQINIGRQFLGHPMNNPFSTPMVTPVSFLLRGMLRPVLLPRSIRL